MKLSVSPYTKLKIRNVLFITMAWIVVGVLIAVYNHFIGKSVTELEYRNYDLETNIITNVISTFIAGLIGGAVLIFFLKDKFRKKPLGISILIYTASVVFIIVVISILAYAFYNWYYGVPMAFDGDFGYNLQDYIGTNTFWLNMAAWTIVSTCTIIILQVNDKYGQGVFLKMMLGEYHRPKKERRIFMFMDMRSSTTIAESLGHRKYFKLLNELIDLITKPIVNSMGEIYQYVGDEVVVSWLIEEDIPKENSLRCFYEIKKSIKDRAAYFKSIYGHIPEFKAGIHCGDVTSGEIGTYKKEIVFTGDTVNTTARIEEKCNEFNEEILISREYREYVRNENSQFNFREICTIELRGKSEPIQILAVDPAP